ncbi:hypothetical protein [Sagittula salina]|uniref:Uncharacterized protein n=1 Tax=Sagittula salina TaxID=2820268 RepID=A0A940MSU0_9RHOB|nr:hypothetical protein [Sagittula salina]MBP0484764.1 hypothetical protein [Sagittula salina]
MIELIFVACMFGAQSQSANCQERSLLFTDVTPMTCMMGAQPQLAQWVNEHPGQRVRSWKCRLVNLAEREA